MSLSFFSLPVTTIERSRRAFRAYTSGYWSHGAFPLTRVCIVIRMQTPQEVYKHLNGFRKVGLVVLFSVSRGP